MHWKDKSQRTTISLNPETRKLLDSFMIEMRDEDDKSYRSMDKLIKDMIEFIREGLGMEEAQKLEPEEDVEE